MHKTLLLLLLLLLLMLVFACPRLFAVGKHSNIGIKLNYVRGLRTKSPEIYNNVCTSDFKIIFLTETRLSDLIFNVFFFLNYILRIVPIDFTTPEVKMCLLPPSSGK
jgi:hypothetical protein